MGATAPASFEEFYVATRDRCFRAVAVTVADTDEADDLLAEAYTRALARWSTLVDHPTPAAWVVRTALNLHRDRWRRSRRSQRHLARMRDVPYEDDTDPRILDAIRALPVRQREAVALRVVLGLSAEQAATMLGIDAGTVGTHLRRALAALRDSLEPAAPTTSALTCQEIRP